MAGFFSYNTNNIRSSVFNMTIAFLNSCNSTIIPALRAFPVNFIFFKVDFTGYIPCATFSEASYTC